MKKQLLILFFIFHTGVIIFISCKKEYSCENCGINKPPIADAGPDQAIVLPTDSVMLDGSNSHDPDGSITSFLWKKISGPVSSTINNTSVAKPTVKGLVIGIYQFELKVTDNKGLSAKDTMQVIVDSVAGTNHPPTAKAGDDVKTIYCLDGQWIGRNDSIILDGGGSTDPDNNIVSYQWTRISGPPLPALSPANIPGHPTQIAIINLQPGIVSLELKVTDAGGLISRDTAEVIITLNQPPVADAGAIPAITLPTNTVTLDGSGSTDPENNIQSYQWTKISGPASFNIANPTARQTQVSSLVAGNYEFELKVTDACGLVSTDMVQVIVNDQPPTSCNLNTRQEVTATLTPIGILSVGRSELVAGASGNKILFAGGTDQTAYSSRVDIYDVSTNTWSTAELTVPERAGMATATVGNKIFFAGGGDDSWTAVTSRVDIYNESTNSWSTAELSQPRKYLSATTLGNKIFFGGGGYWGGLSCGTPPPGWPPNAAYYIGSNVVDIFDNTTNSWSTTTLSEGRFELSATATADKIYFAGGFKSIFCNSTRIDIYNATTNSWSTSQLNEPKAAHAGVEINNKIFWAAGSITSYWAGLNFSQQVEIRDVNTGASTFDCITPKAQFKVVKKDNNVIFFTGAGGPGNKFDIYNTTTNTWSIGVLPVEIYGAAIIAVNNTVYVAGGIVNGAYSNQVWKLDF